MRYKVTRNGEVIVITDNFKNAVMAYNKSIYFGKAGDIVRMLYRNDPNKPWQNIRKDWL